MDLRPDHIASKLLPPGIFFLVVLALCAGAFSVTSRELQVAQISGALQGVSVTVRVSQEIDCEIPAEPVTRVYFDIVPKEGGELTVIDHGMVRKFDALASYEEAGLDGYFGNGDYEGLLTTRPGYTLSIPAVIPFSVKSRCGKEPPPPDPQPTSTAPTLVETTTLPAPEKIAPAPPEPIATKPSLTPKTTSEPAPVTQTIDTEAESATTVKPATCASAEECANICATEKNNASACAEFVAQAVVPVPLSTLLTEAAGNTVFETAVATLLEERSGARPYTDSDQDGIVDFDEVNIYETDPKQTDSDQDGVEDGAEILAGTNPVSKAGGDRATVLFEDPATHGTTASSTFVVSGIDVSATKIDAGGTERIAALSLSGKAPANSFVTLFIYSEPIVVTVKTDSFGSWIYTLDKELPDGTHEVVAAVTDSGGRVLAKSTPLPFIQTASAITVGTPVFSSNTSEAPSFWSGNGTLMVAGVLVITLLLGILVLGFLRTKRSGSPA